ncbi:response regulator [Pinibacter aurantiacus]|uniref:Response regulator transcription factor n=1 Tax=Pinibacter aurantiacus TaxID=2851599 RepID=A0A9E2SEU7_9BACT|nr:response regulator transcription factor [Pinibacter aurantiacus]MBV4360489.1 response regulator transcription factor [Pinibacter aurantiacus]
MAISIFIVDDHYMVIEGIRSLFQHEKNVVWLGHATNAASCLAFLKQQLPDIILLDINLPDKSGIDLCKEIKTLYPTVCVIGLSTFNQQSFIEKMMANGASGYVLKNATQKELMDSFETVMKGRAYLSHEVAQMLRSNEAADDAPVLTRREKEVLELIAEGLTNNEMAEKLFVSASTIDTHRKNLLMKLNAKNTAELVKLALIKKLISFS